MGHNRVTPHIYVCIYIVKSTSRVTQQWVQQPSQPGRGASRQGMWCTKVHKTFGDLSMEWSHHQHQGGQLKQIYTPDLRVRLRDGGILDLSVCRADKVDIWKLKLDSVQPEQCNACGNARLWGMGKGRFRLCDEHNSWYVYLKLRCKKWARYSGITNTGEPPKRKDISAWNAANWLYTRPGEKLMESWPRSIGIAPQIMILKMGKRNNAKPLPESIRR